MCHQTVSLIARELEAAGIPTVILGSALDIVEHCGVPRFVFTDFPLGNPCGEPWNRDMQWDIVTTALDALAQAREPRTRVDIPYRWQTDTWRTRYMEVTEANRASLQRKGLERRAMRASARPRVGSD